MMIHYHITTKNITTFTTTSTLLSYNHTTTTHRCICRMYEIYINSLHNRAILLLSLRISKVFKVTCVEIAHNNRSIRGFETPLFQ